MVYFIFKSTYQFGKISNTSSKKRLIKRGVLQGSILEPIPFLIYINDIKNSSKKLNFYLLAEDGSLLLTGKTIKQKQKIWNPR